MRHVSKAGVAREWPLDELVVAARQSIRRALASRVEPHGVTPAQYALLRRVSQESGASLSEIACAEHLDEATASRVLATLKSRGLVESHAVPTNRRRSSTRLTPQGAALLTRLSSVGARLRAAQTMGLSVDEVRKASWVLEQVIRNMNEFAQAADRPPGWPVIHRGEP